jgi:hypothetical protein
VIPALAASPLYPTPQGSPLRVAVLLGGEFAPAWLCEALNSLGDAVFLDLQWYQVIGVPGVRQGNSAYERYQRFDMRLLAELKPILQMRAIRQIGHAEALHFVADESAGSSLDAHGLARLREQPLDLILLVGMPPAAVSLAACARLGAWTIPPEELCAIHSGRWLMADFMRGAECTLGGLRVYSSQAKGWLLLEPGESSVAQLSFARHRAYQLQKGPAQLLRALRRVAHGMTPRSRAGNAETRPGVRTLFRLALRLMARAWSRHRPRLGRAERWCIAVRESDHGLDPDRPHAHGFLRIEAPKGQFWADPMPWVEHGRRFVLVESWDYARQLGDLLALELDAQLQVRQVTTALRESYHLSFPMLFRWAEQTCMVAESAQAKRVDLRVAQRFPDRWSNMATLLHGWRVVDATLTEHDGRWWMFASVAETPFDDGGREWNELFLFHAESPLGPWQPHPGNPICTDVRRSRSAGPLFFHHGRLIRPAQDCAAEYGRAVVFNEVTTLSTEHFAERRLGTLEPDWLPGIAGCHTYARHARLDVLDAKYLAPRADTRAT